MKHPIILIMTDQHRVDTMHYENPDSICYTPNLDALASESLCFTRAYTNAPVCTPARAALHTGLYPSVTGMCTNLYQQGCQTHELADTPYLLSRRLIEAGYTCGFTGKWHLGMGKDKTASREGRDLLARREKGYMGVEAYLNYGTLPTDVGFIGDDVPGHGNGGYKTEFFEKHVQEEGFTVEMKDCYGGKRPGDHAHGGVIVSGEKTSVEYYLSQRAIQIVDEMKEKDQPMFMALNYWGPHEPYFCLEEDFARYRDVKIPPWRTFTGSLDVQNKMHQIVQRPEMGWDFFEKNLKHYYACITGIDRSIGHFMDHLKKIGVYDDAYIIFCADHADSQGCHNGLENKSCHMYDDVTRIPLMIKPPKGMEKKTTKALATTVDIYATIMNIAGFGEDKFQSGHSLLPILEGKAEKVRDYAVCESVGAFNLMSIQRMYRTEEYKYVFNNGGEDELYCLKDDPDEMHNLVQDPAYAQILHEHREGLAKAMYHHGDNNAPFYCKMNHLLDWAL